MTTLLTMADITSHPQWYLEIRGQKTGPFSQEQLAVLMKEGKVVSSQRVTTASMNGQWITIDQLLKKAASAPEAAIVLDLDSRNEPKIQIERTQTGLQKEPTVRSAKATPKVPIAPAPASPSKTPPARPKSPKQTSSSDDNTSRLFEMLQSTRSPDDTRPKIIPPSLSPRPESTQKVEELVQKLQQVGTKISKTDLSKIRIPRIPTQLWVIAVLGLLLFLMVWGVSGFLKKRAARLEFEKQAASSQSFTPAPPPAITTQQRTAPKAFAPPPPPVAAPVQTATTPQQAAPPPPPEPAPPPPAEPEAPTEPPRVPERDAPPNDPDHPRHLPEPGADGAPNPPGAPDDGNPPPAPPNPEEPAAP